MKVEGEKYSSMLVPDNEEVKKKILYKFHDDQLAGHPGQRQTIYQVKRKFWWEGIEENVREYVGTCLICARSKPNNTSGQVQQKTRFVGRVWENVSLDFMGPYPRTRNGKKFILVVTDMFSKWVEIVPVSVCTAKKTLEVLTEIFSRNGYPRTLLTDNASSFKCKLWEDQCLKWNVEIWTTPVYHPRANPTERVNQEIKKIIRTNLDFSHRTWDEKLSEIGFSLRNRWNESTGRTPAELMYGRELMRPGEWIISQEEKKDDVEEVREEARKKALEKRKEFCTRRNKENVRNGKMTNFEVGNLVLVKEHKLSNAAGDVVAGFCPKYSSPKKIIEKISEDVFLIQNKQPKRLVKVHRDDLKIYRPRTVFSNTRSSSLAVGVLSQKLQ